MRTLLACATMLECAPLLEGGPAWQALEIGGRQAYELEDESALVVVSGPGKVNCAQALTAAIEHAGACPALVCFGSCGAWPGSGLGPGDLVVASEEITDELAVLPEGLATLADIGLALAKDEDGSPRHNRFPADPALARLALAACRKSAPAGVGVELGPLLTVSRITSSAAEAGRLGKVFGPPLAESMEGAAAAQVAHHYCLRFCEVRGVSNLVDDRKRQRWDFELAARRCAAAVGALLAAMSEEES